jgi:hypothetical protein
MRYFFLSARLVTAAPNTAVGQAVAAQAMPEAAPPVSFFCELRGHDLIVQLEAGVSQPLRSSWAGLGTRLARVTI